MPEPATNGTMLLISLGPIQDFIQSARRCQDLWFGSWLLSDLARTVAHAVQGAVAKQGGSAEGCIVFPAGLAAASAEGQRQAERPGVSNLIFARLPPGLEPAQVAAVAEQAVQEELRDLRGAAFEALRGDDNFKADIAEAQINELMELSWVSAHETGDYAANRRVLYERMAALKNTRRWAQPGWAAGSGVPKSSLDGERESVLHERIYDEGKGKTPPPHFVPPEQRRELYGVKAAERLCGVGLLKRRGQELPDEHFRKQRRSEKPRFHSTSHIAAVPTLVQLARHPEAVHTALGALREAGLVLDRFAVAGGSGQPTLGGFDGSLLYISRMGEHFEDSAPDVNVDDRRAAARKGEAAIRRLLHAAGCAEPSPYYAYLLADGDNMGAAIDAIQTPEGHRALAAALNGFATGCKAIVAEHLGSLIFAGGDDVLGLLPLHTALACARALAEAFASALAPTIPAGVTAPTLSVGLAISHAREPMSEARALAKRAEAAAKAVPGKGALCVLLSRRSGGDLMVSGRWSPAAPALVGAGTGPFAADVRLKAWVKIVSEGGLSAKAAHDLEQVAAHFDGLSAMEQDARRGEAESLCKQVLARKRRVGGGEREGAGAEGEQGVEALLRRLYWPGRPMVDNIRAVSTELQLARLLASADRQAAGSDDDAQGEW